ncbi:xylulokinase [Kovacikia minuta CCNUW1]|uniref:xylulokinase n=1 Tax=Kovacikia minuta TaxID=2931930 RepID=UPI001CCD802B|nr:xylulokinase [Kovacikia minuta]UBF29013.1 xylulokinase [Kovacikia minuta CCNUW1]
MFLGIDLGTGSAKALLFAIDGTVIAEASSAYPVQAPKPGWAETAPADWWTAVASAVRAVVAAHAEQIQAIGLSGQMHGVVLANHKGEPLRPAILWADTRSSTVLDAYHTLPANLRSCLANPFTVGMAGPSLLWVQQQEPDVYAESRWALQPKDWLRLQLTGEVATEPSDASGTLLYDVLSDDWAWDVLETLGLRSDWLPTLIPSDEIAGYLTAEASEQLGLAKGLPIVAGAADTAAAALGSGLLQPGLVQLTVGSGAQIATPRSQPEVDPFGRTHLYRTAIPEQWYTLAAIQNAGLALEWVRNILGMSWQQVYAEAFTIAPGCEGLTFLPYLTGERTPYLDPKPLGTWVGMGLHHTRSHLMRAALEGVAFSLKQGLEALTATGVRVTELRLAGGGTLEPNWRQLLADVLQVPLSSLTLSAASARGAAILAGMGIGTYATASAAPQLPINPIPTLPAPFNPELETAWERYQSLYPSLQQWKGVGDRG